MTIAYVTPTTAKAQLGITDTTDDALLQLLCDRANAWIESKTGRVFGTDPNGSYTQDGADALNGGRLMLFPRGIVSLSKLELAFYTGGSWNTIPATDYFLRPSGPDLQPGWPYTELWMSDVPTSGNPQPTITNGLDNVRLTGVFGWPAVPSDIVDIVMTMVVGLYRGRSAAGGTDSVTIGLDGERTISRLLSYEQNQTIRRYRRVDVDII